MQNYVVDDSRKMYTADGKALDVVGVGDVHIALLNRSVWTLQQVRDVPYLKKAGSLWDRLMMMVIH